MTGSYNSYSLDAEKLGRKVAKALLVYTGLIGETTGLAIARSIEGSVLPRMVHTSRLPKIDGGREESQFMDLGKECSVFYFP